MSSVNKHETKITGLGSSHTFFHSMSGGVVEKLKSEVNKLELLAEKYADLSDYYSGKLTKTNFYNQYDRFLSNRDASENAMEARDCLVELVGRLSNIIGSESTRLFPYQVQLLLTPVRSLILVKSMGCDNFIAKWMS